MLKAIYLKKCEDMIRTHSSSFYQAFRLLPSPRKEAVYVIYAFCRMIDDAVDEPESAPFTLEQLRQAFDNLEEAEGHFIWPALRWLFDSFPVQKQPFFTQMDGQQRDLVQTTYETFDELNTYCYQVAGTVGEMLLPVLHDAPNASVVEAGIHLGKAMQIVNIIRDVGEDQRRGRRYLPHELMQKHGYTLDAFNKNIVNASFKKVIDELTEIADQWFQKGLLALAQFPSRSRFCMELSVAYYRAILDVATTLNHYEVFQTRAFVTDRMKLDLFKKVSEKSLEDKEGLAFI